MSNFKFGRSFNKGFKIVVVDFDQPLRHFDMSQEMLQRLSQQRARGREEAETRLREATERGLQIHRETIDRLKIEETLYNCIQSESVQRYVEERDELTRRRWDEQKGYQHGF